MFLKKPTPAPTTIPLALVYSKQAPAQGTGIVPAAESQAIQLNKKIGAGKMLDPTAKEILLGKDLAERLEAKVGEKITLMGKKAEEGGISMITLKITGIFSLGNGAQDKMFYVNLPTAQYFLDVPDQATYLLLFGKGIWSSTAIAAALKQRKLSTQATIQRWQDTPFGATMLPMAQVMLFVLGGLIVFIGGIGLLNTLMMSVLERKNEIGIMMALGLAPRRIGGIFLFEGVLFGFIGAIVGVSLAVIASIPLITKGLSFGAAASKLPIPIEESFKGVLTPTGIMVGLLVGILSTVVGALWPSYKASQTDPIEALRKS
jgi:putative ABC transport system permease protein